MERKRQYSKQRLLLLCLDIECKLELILDNFFFSSNIISSIFVRCIDFQHRYCFFSITHFHYNFPGSSYVTKPIKGGLIECLTQLQTLQEQKDSLEAQQNTCYQQLTTCNNQLTQVDADLSTCNITLSSYQAVQPEFNRCIDVRSISACNADPGCITMCASNGVLAVYS